MIRNLFTALLCTTLALAAAAERPNRFVAGGTVTQSEPVEGDLVSFGGDIDLAAPVEGDAVLGGGNVRIRDTVSRDLYAGGGNVRLEGVVARNARLAGGNIDIAPTASIGGRLSAAGGSITIRGAVGGSIEVASGDVLIDASVGGDVRVAAGSVELGPNAHVAGRLLHQGWVDVRRDPAAIVAGGVERRDPARDRRIRNPSAFTSGWPWSVGLILLAAVLAAAFPAIATRLGASLREKPGLAFFFGFLVLACVPIAALIMGITIVGLPVALLLLLAYLLLLVLGYAATGVLIGDAVLARWRSADAGQLAWRAGAAAAAALALAILGRVPVVGWLIGLTAVLVGIGAIAVTLADRHAARRAPA